MADGDCDTGGSWGGGPGCRRGQHRRTTGGPAVQWSSPGHPGEYVGAICLEKGQALCKCQIYGEKNYANGGSTLPPIRVEFVML